MLASKLIIVTGISGTGKSTTAKQLAGFIRGNGRNCLYLHEECENHPIRENEFSWGSLTSVDGMDLNCKMMLRKWAGFACGIGETPVLLEACLYENIVRYFFECDYPEARIIKFYDDLMVLLEPLQPAIIHLRTSDVRQTFERAFAIRGQWWKKLILEDRCSYFLARGYEGDEGNFQLARDYQNIAIKAFDRYRGPKLQIDTLNQDWPAYQQKICDFLQIRYLPPPQIKSENNGEYEGRYEVVLKGKPSGFEVFSEGGKLWCRSFWPYMELVREGKDRFGFLSFPIDLLFIRENSLVTGVKVRGNYDWGLCGHHLRKIL